LKLIDAGADAIEPGVDEVMILTEPVKLSSVAELLKSEGVDGAEAHLRHVARDPLPVSEDDAQKLIALRDELEAHDDCTFVETNATANETDHSGS
jgi:transcriptional/translational regulatory protein YebC/TACO1